MMSDKDTKYTKLFVGGIPYSSEDDALKKVFGEFGEIVEAVVIRDRITKKSKGYGFVTMATSDAAANACKNKRPIIEGRQANVNLAYLGAKPKPAKTQGKLTINPNYSYQQACAVSSAPQYLYAAPLYSPTQAPSQGSLSVIPPQSSTGPLPQSLAAFQQPCLVDYGNGTMVLVNTLYDPGFYYQTPATYVPSPTTTNSVGQTFTFPPGPATPPLSAPINGQAFFPTTAFDMGAVQAQVQCQ